VSIHKQCTLKSTWPPVASPPRSGPARAKSPVHHSVAATVSRPGQQLEPGVRSEFTSRFGRDFSDVRVHADADAATSAARLGASAYTVGRSIVFGQDQYAAATAAGRNLIAHELAHVVQQHSAVGEAAGVASPAGDLERDAERATGAGRPPILDRHLFAEHARGGLLHLHTPGVGAEAVQRRLRARRHP